MIRCITVDDEPLALRQMESYIEKTPFLQLLKGFESALEANDFVRNNDVDLIYLDINMPDINGMDFVKLLDSPPKIIFTTAYSEYALEGFKLDAADYLLKPIAYSEFLKSANKVISRYFNKVDTSENLNTSPDYLFVKSEYRILKIEFRKIIYIEGMREYVRIFSEDQKPVMSLLSMKKVQSVLPEKDFMRVHRSYIVNLNKVTMVERSRIIFNQDTYIPVSEQYKSDFQEFLDSRFLK